MSYRRNRRRKDQRILRKFYLTEGVGLEPGEAKRFDRLYWTAMSS